MDCAKHFLKTSFGSHLPTHPTTFLKNLPTFSFYLLFNCLINPPTHPPQGNQVYCNPWPLTMPFNCALFRGSRLFRLPSFLLLIDFLYIKLSISQVWVHNQFLSSPWNKSQTSIGLVKFRLFSRIEKESSIFKKLDHFDITFLFCRYPVKCFRGFRGTFPGKRAILTHFPLPGYYSLN